MPVPPPIEVEGLSKHYGHQQVLKNVAFAVPAGSVTGFLGPNGAGKSTTMRALVGLTRPTSGVARVLGGRYVEMPNPGHSVGVLLDASAQHAGRTGLEVLRIGASYLGLPPSRAEELIEIVGLTRHEARKRVGQYSLGMRQRLGIAQAVLGDPQVLILDEPANGLDPSGIRWMRTLLRDFADNGGAVLLSSHLLHEVEVVADELVLIDGGEIVAHGRKADLLGQTGTFISSSEPDRLARALESSGLSFTEAGGGFRVQTADTGELTGVAGAAGAPVTELRPAAGLEDLFLSLTTARSQGGDL
jgi:ABC-2 type transport system ATP-binding protein